MREGEGEREGEKEGEGESKTEREKERQKETEAVCANCKRFIFSLFYKLSQTQLGCYF